MDMNDRLSRLEHGLIDLAIVVTEGHLAPAHIAPEVVEARRRLQGFCQAAVNERTL